MSKKEFLSEFVEAIEGSVKGLIAVAVVEIESGMTLIAKTLVPSFNPDVASAYNVEVVKAKMEAMKALKIDQSDSIDDILITLTSQIHLIKLTPSGTHFIYLAVDAKQANLGMVRSVVRANAIEIDKTL